MRYVDDLVLRDKGSERLYALQDALFNVVTLTDTSGAVKERFAYQPYGKSETLTPTFATRSATLYTWETRFTGRELDLDTGLQLNRNRYYHNQLGRWCSRDPIGYEGSEWNLYEYVNGSPTLHVDPSGLLKGKLYLKCVKRCTCGLKGYKRKSPNAIAAACALMCAAGINPNNCYRVAVVAVSAGAPNPTTAHQAMAVAFCEIIFRG